MIKKALAVMLVVCVASSSAEIYWKNWVMFGGGLAVAAAGGGMLAVGWETHDTGFERIKGNPDTFVKTGEETKMTTVGVSGIAVAFIGLAVAGIGIWLQPFKEYVPPTIQQRAHAPYPTVEPILDIPLFALPSEGVGGGVEFGLPKPEGLRLSLSVADAGAYALAR
jgi:hypothetical protein